MLHFNSLKNEMLSYIEYLSQVSVDGEGSFKINIVEDQNYKTGFHVWLSFSISLHVRDRAALLEKLQLTLGVGRISKHDFESIQIQVTSIKETKKK